MNDLGHSRLRAWINASGLTQGARLPAERELAKMLNVSRAELRKGLLLLEVEGVLQRQVGRGTFIAQPIVPRKGGGPSVSIAEIAERTGPHEAMMARLAIEPELARMAALNAAPRQMRTLRELAAAMRRATTWMTYEDLDAQFHDTIAAASGNALLHEVHKIVNGVRLVVVWRRLSTPDTGPASDYHSLDEHDAIVAALEVHDAPAAHAAMLAHLRSTLRTMTGAA